MQEGVAAIILKSMSEVPDLFNGNIQFTPFAISVANIIHRLLAVIEYGGSDGLVVPVIFDEGNDGTVMQMVPTVLQSRVEAGYLQLRAYNRAGYPNALCPGVR